MSTLNKDQKEASDFFFSMLFQDGIKEFAIAGGAGKGKTYLLGHLVDEVIPNYRNTCKIMGVTPKYDHVVMTATTNKAAEVLSLATGKDTSTIHSFFNLTIRQDYSTGQTKLVKGKQWRVHENTIIFIDEGYYSDTPLRNYILEGTKNCKIIYVGDKNQMAPVKEKISPVAHPANAIPTINLTIPVRNSGKPELVAVCDQLVETVETGIFKDIQIHPGTIDYLTDDEATDAIISHFSQQNTDSRIMCFHNERVHEFNTYIRQLRNLPDQYQVGEYLICNSAIRVGTTKLSIEDLVCIESMGSTETIYINEDLEFPVEIIPTKLSTKNHPEGMWLPTCSDTNFIKELSKYFKKNKMWGHFFFLQNNIPDLRPRDACTVYKAQGSTLDNAFIDLTDISKCGVPDTVARLLHVAFSRARNNVYLFGELNPKFGRIVR